MGFVIDLQRKFLKAHLKYDWCIDTYLISFSCFYWEAFLTTILQNFTIIAKTRSMLTQTQGRPRILLVADYLEGTGFHRVAQHIKKALSPHFEIHQVGIAYWGEVFVDDDGTTIYPQADQQDGQMGHKHIGRLIEQLQPAVFFIVYDIIFVRFLLEALRYQTHLMVTGAYIALDGHIVKKRKMIAPLKKLDFCVLYNQYAFEQIQNLLKEQPSLLPKKVDFEIIPHGVETSIFYPLDHSSQQRRTTARKQLFPNLKNPDQVFIVLNANRPTSRKRLDITLQAFAEFAQGKSSNDVKLCLHHTFTNGQLSDDIQQLVRTIALQDYVLPSPIAMGQNTVDNTTLNLIYNACDVGLNTCMGEGWGLVNCEHGATQAAQILPKHTSFPEIWQQAAAWVMPTGLVKVDFTSHQMYELAPDAVAQQLALLYHNPSLRNRLALAALKKMNEAQYSWEKIEQKWEALFLKHLQRLPTLAH